MKKSYNNFFCPHEVYEDIKFKKMPLSAKHLYTILCKLANRHSDRSGWFFRSIQQLMEDTNLSRSVVISAKKNLIKNQFIDIKRGYYLHSKTRTYDYFRLNGFRFMAKETRT